MPASKAGSCRPTATTACRRSFCGVIMTPANDRGLALSGSAVRRQIAALPCHLYEVRLIHGESRRPYPGVRRWTALQILKPATVGFLRIRNREGYDVYFRPYA